MQSLRQWVNIFKDRLTAKINDLIVDALKDIPGIVPQVKEITILEISNE